MLVNTAEENTGSTNAKRIELSNPNLSHKKNCVNGNRNSCPVSLAIPSRWKDIQHFLPKSVGHIGIKMILFPFFLSPVRVKSILKGHGEPFVLHMLSQYFTNAASAANHWLQFWAATHQ